MKKNLGVVPAVYPMPVLMVAAYDETGKVNVMNAAWGMICNMDRIALFIDEDHKTTQNILKTKAFTVSIADREHMDVADFFGIAKCDSPVLFNLSYSLGSLFADLVGSTLHHPATAAGNDLIKSEVIENVILGDSARGHKAN